MFANPKTTNEVAYMSAHLLCTSYKLVLFTTLNPNSKFLQYPMIHFNSFKYRMDPTCIDQAETTAPLTGKLGKLMDNSFSRVKQGERQLCHLRVIERKALTVLRVSG